MTFIKQNGLVSYETVGKFISELRKEVWHDLEKQLRKKGYTRSLESLMPAFEFFANIGHIDLEVADVGPNKILVYGTVKPTQKRAKQIIKEIR